MPTADRLTLTFAALAHPARRGILAKLANGDASVTELAEPYAMSMAAISKHLKVLEGAGLVSRGKDAQWRPCHLEAQPLAAAQGWIEEYRRFWERNMDSLGEYLQTMQAGSRKPKGKPTASRRKRK